MGPTKRFGLGTTSILALAAFAAALAPGAPPAPAAQNQSGLEVFRSNCDGCHELPDPERPQRTRTEWEAVLQKMVKEKGAALDRQEFAVVLNYLDSFNQQVKEVAWAEKPAATHRFDFDAKLAGRLPDPWVGIAIGPGPAAEAKWLVHKNAAGPAVHLAPSAGLPDGRQQLLIDNTGTVTAGSVSTRLAFPAGPPAAGAGVVFGFRGPQSYYGVRVSPAGKNVILYQVDGGDRALLGRAGLAAAAGAPLPLKLDLAQNQVKVSVGGEVVLTRPLTGYRGGLVGLATDGATLGRFDQWSVESR